MEQTDAKYIILLAQAPKEKKNLHWLGAKVGKTYHTVYHRCKGLAEVGYIQIQKSQLGGKTYYEPTDVGIETAKQILSEEKDVLQRKTGTTNTTQTEKETHQES